MSLNQSDINIINHEFNKLDSLIIKRINFYFDKLYIIFINSHIVNNNITVVDYDNLINHFNILKQSNIIITNDLVHIYIIESINKLLLHYKYLIDHYKYLNLITQFYNLVDI